jgi:hypothetical protein
MVLNKEVIKSTDLKSAVMYSAISSLLSNKNKGIFVPVSIDYVKNEFFLSEAEQVSCVKKLISAGLVEKKVFGLPAKRHFKVLK